MFHLIGTRTICRKWRVQAARSVSVAGRSHVTGAASANRGPLAESLCCRHQASQLTLKLYSLSYASGFAHYQARCKTDSDVFNRRLILDHPD